jgi:hypothetical protein
MVIQSRTIVGAAAALAIVGAGLWVSTMALGPSHENRGIVEVQQINEPSWTVEVKEIDGSESIQKTASR